MIQSIVHQAALDAQTLNTVSKQLMSAEQDIKKVTTKHWLYECKLPVACNIYSDCKFTGTTSLFWFMSWHAVCVLVSHAHTEF